MSRLAETNVGGVVSYVDPFGTGIDATETASFPAMSWTALFDPDVFEDGALYAIVTSAPFSTTEASVNCTIEPLTTTEETERSTPATVTTKSPGKAVVAFNSSLYVIVRIVPRLFTEAALNIGARVSTGTTELESGEFVEIASTFTAVA